MSPAKHKAIETEVLRLCRQRGGGKTICPSEVARRVTPQGHDWRGAMDDVRRVAGRLAAIGCIEVYQRGAPVDPFAARGPIRLGLPPRA